METISEMKVTLNWVTPEGEKQILRMARVSSNDRDSEDTRLLGYLIRNQHWSPFEMANMCVEVVVSRAIIRQLLRHRSFSFQEFSQRYQSLSEESFITNEARRQDFKNRQKSIDDLDNQVKKEWEDKQRSINKKIQETYQWALDKGIAKECARSILPEGNVLTTVCINGTLRSWIHYLTLRCGFGTQKEHQDVAIAIRDIFIQQFPIISKTVFSEIINQK